MTYHKHTLHVRLFNMNQIFTASTKEKMTLFGACKYVEEKHGDTAMLIKIIHADGSEEQNPNYKPFHIKSELSNSLTKQKLK